MTVFRFLIVLSCIIAASCSNIETHDNKLLSRSAVVSKYNSKSPIPSGASFGWAEDKIHVYADNRLPTKEIARMLKDSIANELIARGLSPAAKNTKPDYSVVYVAALKNDLDDNVILQQYGIQPGLTENQVDPDKLEKGTIIIDLIDNTSNTLYWRSIGQAFANLEQIPLEQRSQRVSNFIKLQMKDLAHTSD